MAGTNAAVVGILGAACYQPVWTTAALSAFIPLTAGRAPPWQVVVATVAGRLVLGRIAPVM